MRFILHDANSHFLIVQFFLIFNAEKIAALHCLVDQNATHIRLLAQVSGSLADEDIIAKLLVESDPHKIIALFNSETENADA